MVSAVCCVRLMNHRSVPLKQTIHYTLIIIIKECVVYFHSFSKFPVFLLLWISSFIPFWLEKVLCIISILLTLGRTYGLFWRIFQVHLGRMCILILADLSYICLLGLVSLKCCSSPFPY